MLVMPDSSAEKTQYSIMGFNTALKYELDGSFERQSNFMGRSALSSVRGSTDFCVGTRPIFDKRPAPISNRALIDLIYSDGLTLKEDLIEHHDYETVLPKVWDYLVSWYDFTDKEPILRPIKYDR